MRKPKPKQWLAPTEQRVESAVQYGLNTYEETLILIRELSFKIGTEVGHQKAIDQSYKIRTMAERIIYFANDLSKNFNKKV